MPGGPYGLPGFSKGVHNGVMSDDVTTILRRALGDPTDDGDPPIYTSLGPVPTWTEPPTPKFSVMGYKRRTKLAAETNRVLAAAGFKNKKAKR